MHFKWLLQLNRQGIQPEEGVRDDAYHGGRHQAKRGHYPDRQEEAVYVDGPIQQQRVRKRYRCAFDALALHGGLHHVGTGHVQLVAVCRLNLFIGQALLQVRPHPQHQVAQLV